MRPIRATMAYGRGILTQIYYHTTSQGHSAAFYVIWFAVAIALACIPAAIASGKGYAFGLWFLFGLFCFVPALIVSIVISDRGRPRSQPDWNPHGPSQSWAPPPAGPPPGWYPDPGGTAAQRYWDGNRWTEHTQ